MNSVVVGRFTPEQAEAIRMALARAGMEQRVAQDGQVARRMLGDPSAKPPRLILVDAAMVELEPLMTWLRGQARLFGAMVVAVVPAPSERGLAEAIAAGCDDAVLQGDLGAITRRAVALREYDPTARPAVTQGRVIIAHPADHRRRLTGRTLRLGGFDTVFAQTDEELERSVASLDEPPALLVVSTAIAGGAAPWIAAARRATGRTSLPAVVVGSESELSEAFAAMRMDRVAPLDEQAPPDNLLFVANELLRPGVRNLRASQRALCATTCAFRPAGRLHPVLGLTYNLSREGLYVRTLDPPARGTDLWFELRPPGSNEAVHLRGKVVWTRDVGHGPGGAAPPGFGVRIDEQACPPADLERYRAGYAVLVHAPRLVA